jgi:outer membrane autotransporter protein
MDFESISAGFAGQLFVGDDLGVGTITQNGANSTVTLNIINIAQFGSNASAGPSLGGTGTYNLLAGTLNIGGHGAAFGMDLGGIGNLNQSGGVLTASAPVIIGNSGTGAYNMSGGIASFGAGLSIAEFAGSIGAVNQTGGVVTITGGSVAIGTAGAATYNLNGGLLQVGGANGITGTGALNLGGGTLQVIGSALTTNIAMGLTGTGSTVDTNGLGATVGGVMSGTGGFTKSGAGTLTLTAANLYTGGTAISGGTLQIGNGGTTGSILGDVVDNGALTFNRSDASAFAGAISGAGSLTKTGAGVLTLSGPGSYSGVTSINVGTLQAGATNAFSASSAFTIATGATLALAGFNNAIGSLAGGGGVTLGSATLNSGNDGTSTTFSGEIGGTGGLTKTGSGTFFLTGASGYTGPTNINAGVLDVNGSLASAVSVNSGATLMGGGSIGGLNVANGGIVAPGNSIGTLHVAGNIGFSSGSVYQVQVNAAGQSDLIAATGHATLTGGNVQVSGTPAANLTYTILTAQGGVNGRFTSVAAPASIFQGLELDYTPTSVLLSLRQTQAFASAATTPNEVSVAAALAALPADSPLYQAALAQTSAAGARQAFNALSGEIHASTQTVMLDDSRYFRQAMLGRMRQADFDGATGPAASLGFGGPPLQYAEPATDFAGRFDPEVAAMSYASTRRAEFPIKALPAMPAPEMVWWTQAVGAWGQIDGNGNAADVSRSFGGFSTGVDRRFDGNWRAGIAAGYNNSMVSDSARASSANIDTAQFGAYAGTNHGPWNFRAGAAASWSTIATNRSILFPGFSDAASAHYGAAVAQLFDEVGYSMTLGAVAAEPFGGLAWVYLRTDGFNETGNTMAALTGSSRQNDVGYSTLGTRAATSFMLPNATALTVHGSVAWQHAFGDVTPNALLAFQGSAAPFTVAGVPLARDAALVETGLDALIASQTTIGISYTGQLAEHLQDHSVKGNLRVRF